MIGELAYTVLLPVIYPMELLFDFMWTATHSAGLSIILLAAVISILTIPLKKWAKKTEEKFVAVKQLVDADIAKQAAGLKGEKRFEVVEKVYKKHGYHPIKSIVTGISFLVMIPFLISAIFIFGSSDELKGVSFLFVRDLSEQDRLLFGLNLLPVFMLLLGLSEALLRWRSQKEQLIRYFIVSVVLFALVYSFASALILYWISMNACAGIIFLAARSQDPS